MMSRIGKFEILRRLGEGAMGEVFLAHDPVIGREVAIKTIRKDSVALGEAKDEARERFYREARAAGGLNHPNLVTIHEFGEDEGLLYLAMEYVPGEDLTTLVQQRVLTPRELLEVLAQVSDGLAYAHSKGVLHRDIKPSNIRVARLQGKHFAKVMDFGIARIGGSDMTGTGTLLGTFGYMAPEYIQTGTPAPSADLFAVGVILYEALAGRRPFVGDTTATVLYRIVHEQPAPLDLKELPEVSPSLQGVVMRALEKSPADRFPSAEALAAALRGVLDPAWRGPADAAPTVRAARPEPLPSATTAGRPRAAKGRGPWLAAGLALLAGLGSWLAWGGAGSTEPVAPPAASDSAVVPGATVMAPTSSRLPEPKPVPTVTTPKPITTPIPVATPVFPTVAPAREPVRPPAAEPPAPPADPPEAGLDASPGSALRMAEAVLQTQPTQAKAHAIRIASLYDMGRYGEIAGALRASLDAGIPVRALMRFPRFSRMVHQELAERRLPEAVRLQLAQLVEAPSGRPAPPRPRLRFRG